MRLHKCEFFQFLDPCLQSSPLSVALEGESLKWCMLMCTFRLLLVFSLFVDSFLVTCRSFFMLLRPSAFLVGVSPQVLFEFL